VFYERDVPYYAAHRDPVELAGTTIRLYSSWDEIRDRARTDAMDADLAMVTSYCPDGLAASELVLSECRRLRVFYDMDTPITLERFMRGESVPYIGARALRDFDLVLSFTGGGALDALRERLGARRVAPFYGSVDPETHANVSSVDDYRCDMSYLGTYAADRQAALDAFFLDPSDQLSDQKFVLGGALYPAAFPWRKNIFFVGHVSPPKHPAFYCSSRLTLNITRGAMARMGFCPSGRLFEAAACGVPVLSDWWEGLDQFFLPDSEILLARTSNDVVRALNMPAEDLAAIGRAARERALACHTSDSRAGELEKIMDSARSAAAAI